MTFLHLFTHQRPIGKTLWNVAMIEVSITGQAFVTLVVKGNMFYLYLRNNRGVVVKTRKYTKMKNPGVVSMAWKKKNNVSSP